ncbi:MAG: hypothetical protein RL299_733 [Pseudomonadota bacterium]|jgi:hypothetical protein
MTTAFDRRDMLKLAGLAAATALPGGRLLAQGGAAVPIELDFWGGKGAFKMHPRAAILSYPIRFITAGEGNGGGKVGIYLSLKGPSVADMQALTAEARNDLAARLAAIGLPVVPAAEMLANPDFTALPKTPGGAKWDEGVLDPMGKRIWFITGCPDAPLHASWGSTSGSPEMGAMNKMTQTSRSLNAVALVPHLTLEFSTLTGSVKSGSKGSTSWTGGDILFGFKPHSNSFFMAGGKRSIEMVGGGFKTKGRILISGTKLPGELRTGVADPGAELSKRMGRARVDEFAVDMAAWREWVRQAYRGYNAELVRHITTALPK